MHEFAGVRGVTWLFMALMRSGLLEKALRLGLLCIYTLAE